MNEIKYVLKLPAKICVTAIKQLTNKLTTYIVNPIHRNSQYDKSNASIYYL